MQQGCPQPHEEVPSALETLLLESASYLQTPDLYLKITNVPFMTQHVQSQTFISVSS
jgi:hypothetical protein